MHPLNVFLLLAHLHDCHGGLRANICAQSYMAALLRNTTLGTRVKCILRDRNHSLEPAGYLNLPPPGILLSTYLDMYHKPTAFLLHENMDVSDRSGPRSPESSFSTSRSGKLSLPSTTSHGSGWPAEYMGHSQAPCFWYHQYTQLLDQFDELVGVLYRTRVSFFPALQPPR